MASKKCTRRSLSVRSSNSLGFGGGSAGLKSGTFIGCLLNPVGAARPDGRGGAGNNPHGVLPDKRVQTGCRRAAREFRGRPFVNYNLAKVRRRTGRTPEETSETGQGEDSGRRRRPVHPLGS